jgi:hypothetical protein
MAQDAVPIQVLLAAIIGYLHHHLGWI